MNNVCTPAIARRLKEQGFPQPVPEPGQVWYTKSEAPFVVVQPKGSQIAVGWPYVDYSFSHIDKFDIHSCVYAPTAPDILRELGWEWRVGYAEDAKEYFCVHETGRYLYYNDNPAEACAEVWEAKQKQL